MVRLVVGSSEVEVLELLSKRLIVTTSASPNSDGWECTILDYSNSWRGKGKNLREAINNAVKKLKECTPDYLKTWVESFT